MDKQWIIQRDGKDFVLWGGLLDEAHSQGLRAISTILLQIPNADNDYVAICHATVETERGTFQGIGDASPANVARNLLPHTIRMAETRAKARALRDAVNIGVTAQVELGGDGASEDSEQDEPMADDAPRTTPPTPIARGVQTATIAQLRMIHGIRANDLRISEAEMDEHAVNHFGVRVSDLSKRDASTFIDLVRAGGLAVKSTAPPAAPKATGTSVQFCTEQQRALMNGLVKDLGWDSKLARVELKHLTGVEDAALLTYEQAERFLSHLRGLTVSVDRRGTAGDLFEA